MNRLKKLLAVLLCMAMALALVPGVAMAEKTADGLEYKVYDDHVEITGYIGSATTLNIPAEIEGKPVTSIGEMAFCRCTSLASVTIPDSVTDIGFSAFDGTALYNNDANWKDDVLYIDNHLIRARIAISGDYKIHPGTITIADEAFYNCVNLASITIPDSVTIIGRHAFHGCSSLISVNIGNSVTSIGWCAFQDCTRLTSITIPDSVSIISEYLFYGCASLTSVTIPESVTDIGFSAFDGTALYNDEANWTNNVLYIGNHLIKARIAISGYYKIRPGTITIAIGAFEGCTNITSVTIPDSVTSIGDYAFNLCTSLTDVTIPDSVTSIGESAFCRCDSLTSVTIGNGVTSIGNDAFLGCASLTSVTITDGVTTIGWGAFGGCTSLTSVTIPTSVTSIGNYAFGGCTSLTSVTIPTSVTSIDEGAFEECNSLADVYYGGSESDWSKISIGNDNDPLLNATIHYNSTGLEPANPEIKTVSISIDTATGEITVTAQTTAIPAGAALLAIGVGPGGTLIDLAPVSDGKAKLSGENVKTVKVFAWDSLESMRPLCEAKEVVVER